MMRISPIRCGVVAVVLMCAASWLQGQAPVKPSAAVSTLPAAQPTALNPTEATPTPAAAPHHVEVSYSDGKLAVDATNGSLNEILREVSQKTGMKITGGVADDRVFGHYGPSKPSVVLDALLEGTGSNFLLVDGTKGSSELILTPRRGVATPPNPNAAAQTSDAEEGAGQYVPPVRPYQPPVANGRGAVFGTNPDGSQVTVPPGGEQGDGSGSKTPQQIYDQLQRVMQQQKQGANPPPQ